MEVIIDGVAYVPQSDMQKELESVVAELKKRSNHPIVGSKEHNKGLNDAYYYSYKMLETALRGEIIFNQPPRIGPLITAG